MVVLTENMVLSKGRADSLEGIRHLNLWGNQITDVSVLRKMPNVEVLSLSVNQINSLREFQHCPKLSELYLRKNDIQELSEIKYLQKNKALKILWLSDNPCAEQPNYRFYVIKNLPSLIKLDNTDITIDERQNASKISDPLSSNQSPPNQSFIEPPPTPLYPSSSYSPPSITSSSSSISPPQQPQTPSVQPTLPRRRDIQSSHGRLSMDKQNEVTEINQGRDISSAAPSKRPSWYHDPVYPSVVSEQIRNAGSRLSSVQVTSPSSPIDSHSQQSPPDQNIITDQRSNSRRERDKEKDDKPSVGVGAPKASNSNGNGKASNNILYAVLSLLNELDPDSLSIVKSEVESKLRHHNKQ